MPTDAIIPFYVTQKLSGNLSITPEKFLLCTNVPVARTGAMVYGPGETPVEVGGSGYALIDCDAEELFSLNTLASFNGKPVVDEHPDTHDNGVGPDNWRQLARGTGLNARRGTGEMADRLVGDLLVTDQELIEDILGIDRGSFLNMVEDGTIQEFLNNPRGKREISLGYDSDYEQIEPGRGRKKNIIINHTAFVEAGRCGSTCKVNDHLPRRMRKRMPKTVEVSNTLWSKLRKALKANDRKTIDEVMQEMPAEMTDAAEGEGGGGEGGIHVHIHQPEAKPAGAGITAISGDASETEEEKKKREEEAAKKNNDSGRTKFSDEALENRFKGIEDSLEEIKGMKKKEEGEKNAPAEDEEGYLKPKDGDGKMKDNKEVEGELEEEAPEGTGDAAKKANDSAYLVESYRETVAMAEILAPGVKVPTFDQKHHPTLTYDNLCRLRRKALSQGLKTADTAEIISSVRGRATDEAAIKKLTCNSIRTLFIAAANTKKAANNAKANSRRTNDSQSVAVATPPVTITDMNKRNADFWKNRS